jgi:osmoprotectant transport system ATP-binding protein
MINRLIEATDGTIEIAGQDIAQQPVAELRRGIGYVIQQVGLFPHWSIAQNIATVPKTLGWDKKRTSERVHELAELVGLPAETLDRYPNELSGGQQQRVGVARALAADPPLLLMDEPFGAVDPIVRAHLQDELLGLQERMQKTIVFVTHDIDEAVKIADRVALLNVGGVLEQLASPDELLRNPSNEFVEAFIGEDRSLKRLALATVGDLAFNQGPVVDLTASPAEAEKVMAECGTVWFGVTSENAFLGWIEGVDLEAGQPIANLATQLPAAQVAPASTLRSAMELIMTSNTSMAVVNDNGVFGGVVTLEQIRRGLTAHEAP